MKRIVYFLVTNLAIVLVLSITMRILGVEPYLNANGLDLGNLLAFAAIMGFGGAFISLAMSKWTAKRMSGAVVIQEPQTLTEIWLMKTVRVQAFTSGESNTATSGILMPAMSACTRTAFISQISVNVCGS